MRPPKTRQVDGSHHRKAVYRHDDVAAVGIALEIDELVDVVALRDAAVAVDVLLVDARQEDARMQVQVGTDLTARVGDAAIQQDLRRIDGASAEHDDAGGNPVPMLRMSECIDDVSFDASNASALGHDTADRTVGVDARAGAIGRGNVGDEHALLGVERTSQQAETGERTILAIMVGDETVVAELLAALPDLGVERIDLKRLDRLDLEHPLDPLERR